MAISWWIFLAIHMLGTGVIVGKLGQDKGKYDGKDIFSCIIVFLLLAGIYFGI